MLEQTLQSLLLLVPLLGAAALGSASMSMVYLYILAFDFFKCWGHSNFEFVPAWFRNLPGVKYLLYTPSSVPLISLFLYCHNQLYFLLSFMV